MESGLRFRAESALDATLARAVQESVRSQLLGVRVDASAIGTGLVIKADGRNVDEEFLVFLEDAPSSGIVVDRNTVIELDSNGRTDHQSLPDQATNSHGLPLRLRRAIGDYISDGGMEHPDPQRLSVAESRIRGLVGVPAQAVVDELVSRLRGSRWLGEWSMRHHGRRIRSLDIESTTAPLMLLCGDPGTGKSALMSQLPVLVAGGLRKPVLFVQLNERIRGQGIQGRAGSDFMSVLEAIADVSREEDLPSLILLDEADSIASRRGVHDIGSGSQENLAIVDALIKALDRLLVHHQATLAFVMATNLWQRVDPAVVRRASLYTFGRPNKEHMRTLMERTLGDVLSERELDEIVAALDRPHPGLTASDVLHQVVLRAVREAAAANSPIQVSRLMELAQTVTATQPL